jgi:hypothetical protein
MIESRHISMSKQFPAASFGSRLLLQTLTDNRVRLKRATVNHITGRIVRSDATHALVIWDDDDFSHLYRVPLESLEAE